MNARGTLAAALAALTLLTATACGQQTAPTPVARPADPDTSASKPVEITAADLKAAADFERAARDWGADPTVDLTSFKLQPAGDVLAKLRGGLPDGNPVDGMLGFKVDKDSGPDAPNPGCTDELADGPASNAKTMYCDSKMTARDWLKQTYWGVGAKWTDGPNVAAENGKVRVTGTVRVILVQGYDGMDEPLALGDYRSVTPATRDYEISDLVAIRDGKVRRVEHSKDDPWWIDPWITQWDLDMPDDMGDGTRVSIPVKGAPSWPGMVWDSDGGRLKGPESLGDGDVDVTMWGDISGQFASVGQGGGKCQNACEELGLPY